MLTLYAKNVPTCDPCFATPIGKTDVVLYSDKECKFSVAIYIWYLSNKPTKRDKYVMHNCNLHLLEWA